MAGRPINESRQLAILMGDKTYIGVAHDKCGTTERYVKGGGCVYCARVIATEQRDARKFMTAQLAAEVAAELDAKAGLGESVQEFDRRVIDESYLDPNALTPDQMMGHITDLDDADEAAHDEMVAEARNEAADRFRADIEGLM